MDKSWVLAREQELQEEGKEEAIANNRVLLTPLGCSYLYDVTLDTVRQARRRDDANAVAWVVQFADKPVMLLRLDWATRKWLGRFIQERFDEMRNGGMVLGVRGLGYLILHRKPVIVESERREAVRQYTDNLDEGSDE